MKNMTWYHNLNKPVLSPPDCVFAPVWTIIYILILLSFVIFLTLNPIKHLIPFCLFLLQFVLNLSWTPIFFGLKRIRLALFICTLLWISVLLLIITLFPISKLASLLLFPYICWLTFALYLNFMIVRLN